MIKYVFHPHPTKMGKDEHQQCKIMEFHKGKILKMHLRQNGKLYTPHPPSREA